MRVRMLANVGLLETGQEYELPDEQAGNYIRLEYAEEIKPERPTPAEVKPSGVAGKPASRRRTKAVQPPANKAAAKTAPSKPEAEDKASGGSGAATEESG